MDGEPRLAPGERIRVRARSPWSAFAGWASAAVAAALLPDPAAAAPALAAGAAFLHADGTRSSTVTAVTDRRIVMRVTRPGKKDICLSLRWR